MLACGFESRALDAACCGRPTLPSCAHSCGPSKGSGFRVELFRRQLQGCLVQHGGLKPCRAVATAVAGAVAIAEGQGENHT